MSNFAFADYAGFRAGASVNFTGTSSNDSYSGATLNIGQTSVGASIDGAYGFALSSKSLLSVGLSYSPTTLDAGSASYSGTSITLQQKNLWALYAEPGAVINDSTLLYGKLAYSGAQGNVTGNYVGSQTFHGIGYGAGIRQLIDKSFYVQVEAMDISYNSQTVNSVTYKPTVTQGTIGIGYKF